MTPAENPPELSVVIPVFNEAENLDALYGALKPVLDRETPSWELLFVDDGSSDRSLDLLKALHAKEPRVRFLSLSRNFGHQAALTAGLDHARGQAVISMDGDLQHPPEVIPEMVRRWREGNDVVYSIRRYGDGAGVLKRATSSFFYWFMRKISRTEIHPDAADFRLLSRRAVNALVSLREQDRFVRGLVSWIGYRQAAVPFVAPARHGGRSKYSAFRMLRLAADGLTSFSSAPLYLATFFGFVVSVCSFLYMLVVLYWKFFTALTVPGWTSLIIIVLFLGGVQLICVGIVGEYVGKIYHEIKRRPLYLIRETGG
jgi:dolichol-phosphate mannosyltransferase